MTRPPRSCPGDVEPLEAERRHHFDQILSHRALRVREMLRITRRLATGAVAAQIGSNHGKAFRQFWRDLMPHRMRLRTAMDKQQR